MKTARCPVCHMYYKMIGGRVRTHGADGFRWCRGSGQQPLVQSFLSRLK